MGIRGCYIASLARVLQCRLILTYIDTNNWDTGLTGKSGPRVVCVANAMRPPELINTKRFDVFLHPSAFPLCASAGFDLQAREFHAIGQLRAGVFWDKIHKTHTTDEEFISSRRESITWISQYRPRAPNDALVPVFEEKSRVEDLLLSHLRRFAEENRLKVTVALSASLPKRAWIEKECEYYRQRLGSGAELVFRDNDPWASYRMAWNSALVVGLFSNLLYECLALGLRTLICFPAFPGEIRDYAGKVADPQRLQQVSLSGAEYGNFAESCLRLMRCSDAEYSAILANYQEDLTCFHSDHLPQEKLREVLYRLLEES